MPEVYSAGEQKREESGRSENYPHDVVHSVLKKTGERVGSWCFGAYKVCPKKKFVNEQTDEEVVLLLRAHPITNVGWIMLTIIMLVAPEIFILSGVFAGVSGQLVFVGRLVWYLVTLGFAFEKFLYWYYSVVIITNERIVDIDFVNLLHRVISYAALNHIEEPSMVSGGLLRSLLHYGDVNVATAADTPSVEAHAVPYPDRVIKIISELSEELEKRRERGE